MTPQEAKFYGAASAAEKPLNWKMPAMIAAVAMLSGGGGYLLAIKSAQTIPPISTIPSTSSASTPALKKHHSPFFRKPDETDAQFSARMNTLSQGPVNNGQWGDAEFAEVMREHNEFIKGLQEEYRKEKEAEK